MCVITGGKKMFIMHDNGHTSHAFCENLYAPRQKLLWGHLTEVVFFHLQTLYAFLDLNKWEDLWKKLEEM